MLWKVPKQQNTWEDLRLEVPKRIFCGGKILNLSMWIVVIAQCILWTVS